MNRYAIVVYWSDEDSLWIAEVPDLRPCAAHGDTPGEALAELMVAMELWLEVAHEHGMPIPSRASSRRQRRPSRITVLE